MVALWTGSPCLYFIFSLEHYLFPVLKKHQPKYASKEWELHFCEQHYSFFFLFPATHFAFGSLSVSLVSEQMSWQNLFAQVFNSLLEISFCVFRLLLCVVYGKDD